MVLGIWLVLLGGTALLAIRASSKKPLHDLAVASIVLGFLFGPLSGIWGIWGLVGSVLNIGWLSTYPIFWVTQLLASFAQGLTGLAVTVRAIQLIANFELAPLHQTLRPLGILCIAVGLWNIAATLIFTMT